MAPKQLLQGAPNPLAMGSIHLFLLACLPSSAVPPPRPPACSLLTLLPHKERFVY